MTAIPGEFLLALVLAGMDKKKIWKVVRKTSAEKRQLILLKGVKIKKQLEE